MVQRFLFILMNVPWTVTYTQITQQTIALKMADQGRCYFCVVFTMSLCTLELIQTLIKFAISSHTAVKLDKQALRSYLKLTCEYKLHISYQTEKLVLQRIMVKAT